LVCIGSEDICPICDDDGQHAEAEEERQRLLESSSVLAEAEEESRSVLAEPGTPKYIPGIALSMSKSRSRSRSRSRRESKVAKECKTCGGKEYGSCGECSVLAKED